MLQTDVQTECSIERGVTLCHAETERETMTTIQLETPAETRERCKAHSAEWLGDHASYAVTGVSLRRTTVRAIFERHGLQAHLPSDPRPDSLLRRAGAEGITPKGYITRPFVSPNRDTAMAIHVTRVRGTDESGDEYTCLARVRIGHREDPVTGLAEPFAVAKPPEGKTEFADLTARDRAIWIAEQCNTLLQEAQNRDVSQWIRSVYTGLGAAHSLGGGNNYWVPTVLCDRLHALMLDLAAIGVHYERDPKTTMGAPHTRALFAQAAERSLGDDLAAMKAELVAAVDKSGSARKRTASLALQIERLQALGDKISLYKEIVAKRATGPLAEVVELYRQHFSTLIDGGEVTLDGEVPAPTASDSDEGVPVAPDSQSTQYGGPSDDAALAAAPAGGDDLAWCD